MKKINLSQFDFLRIINITLSIVLIASIILFAFARVQEARAAGSTPFGGMSNFVWYCTCSASIAITIDDLTESSGVSGALIFSPASTTLYPYGQVYTEGVWLLGLWESGGSCEYYVGTGCSTYDTEGTMTMVGTSM